MLKHGKTQRLRAPDLWTSSSLSQGVPMSSRTLFVSTRNAHKLAELRQMLKGIGDFDLCSAADAGVPEVEETGSTFVDNAVLKAKAAFEKTGGLCLADDSGLTVNALAGAPGVYSARFAGHGATAAQNNAHLLSQLEGVPEGERGAAFVCQLALIVPASLQETESLKPTTHPWVPPGGRLYAIRGEVEGRILSEGFGGGGFGYDPLFYFEPERMTFAEMSGEAKNAVSHRGRALVQLSHCLTELIGA